MSETLAAVGWHQLFAAVLATLVWLLCRTRPLARRPAIRHGLWLLALIKLATPSFVPVPLLPSLAVRATNSSPESSHESGDAVDRALNHAADSNLVIAAGPVLPALADSRPAEAEAAPSGLYVGEVVPRRGETAILLTLVAMSGAGTAAFWFVAIRRALRTGRLLRTGEAATGRAADLLREVERQFDSKGAARLILVDGPVSPTLWAGWGPPTIVLPQGLADSFADDRLRSIFAHELSHYRRGDHWTSLFAFLVATTLWWNPIAWFARCNLSAAAEERCDAEALERLRGSRRGYAETLLSTLDFTKANPVAGGVGFGRSHALRRRFEMIADSHVVGCAPRGAGAALALGVICSMLAPVRAQEPSDASASPSPAVAATENDQAAQPASVAREPRQDSDGAEKSDAERIAELRLSMRFAPSIMSDESLGGVGALAVWPRWTSILPLGKAQADALVKLDLVVRESRTLAFQEVAEHPADDFATYRAYVDRFDERRNQAIEHAERMATLALLTEEQAKVVRLRNEWRGHDWLSLEGEHAQGVLDATKDQRRKIEEIFDEFSAREGTWGVWDPDQAKRRAERADRLAFRREIEAKAREVLAPEQVERWDAYVAERTLPATPSDLPAYFTEWSGAVPEDSPIFRLLPEHPPSYLGVSRYQKRLLDDLAEVTQTGLLWIRLEELRKASPDVPSEERDARIAKKSAEFLHHAEQIALVGVLSPEQAARFWKLAQED